MKETDTKDFAKQLNNELDNIKNAEDEKRFLKISRLYRLIEQMTQIF